MKIRVDNETWDVKAAAEQIAHLDVERTMLREKANARIDAAKQVLSEAQAAAAPLWDQAQACDAKIEAIASAIAEAAKPQTRAGGSLAMLDR